VPPIAYPLGKDLSPYPKGLWEAWAFDKVVGKDFGPTSGYHHRSSPAPPGSTFIAG